LPPAAPDSISVCALPKNPFEECSPDPVTGFKGPTSKGREEMGRKGGEE